MISGASDSQGLFIVGGVVKSRVTNGDQQVLQDYLSNLLQVHNLVILIGSGASFHLGSRECLMVCVWESIPHKEISQNDYCGKTRPG